MLALEAGFINLLGRADSCINDVLPVRDLGLGDLGRGDLGLGDLGRGDLRRLVGELRLSSLALTLAGEPHLLAPHLHPLAMTLAGHLFFALDHLAFAGLLLLAGLWLLDHLPFALEHTQVMAAHLRKRRTHMHAQGSAHRSHSRCIECVHMLTHFTPSLVVSSKQAQNPSPKF